MARGRGFAGDVKRVLSSVGGHCDRSIGLGFRMLRLGFGYFSELVRYRRGVVNAGWIFQAGGLPRAAAPP